MDRQKIGATSAKWIARAGGLVSGSRAEIKTALRITIAGSLAFAITRAFDLSHGYWAAITAVLVVQASLGASLKAAAERFSGTLVGAIYGALISALIPHQDITGLLTSIALALFPLALLTALNPTFRVAPITALIMLLPLSGPATDPLVSAGARVLEVILGNTVGIVVSLFILPARAHALLAETAAKVVSSFGSAIYNLIDQLLGDPHEGVSSKALSSIRTELKKVEAAAEEANREHKSHLADHADPQPLVRLLYRVWYDVVMLSRATSVTLPVALAESLGPALNAVRDESLSALGGISQDLRERKSPQSLGKLKSAVDRYGKTIQDLSSEELIRETPFEVLERLIALRFVFEQLCEDLSDLSARAQELSGSSLPSAD